MAGASACSAAGCLTQAHGLQGNLAVARCHLHELATGGTLKVVRLQQVGACPIGMQDHSRCSTAFAEM